MTQGTRTGPGVCRKCGNILIFRGRTTCQHRGERVGATEQAREEAAAVVLPDGSVLFVGGYSGGVLSSAERYR
jgi:hypothetical protein